MCSLTAIIATLTTSTILANAGSNDDDELWLRLLDEDSGSEVMSETFSAGNVLEHDVAGGDPEEAEDCVETDGKSQQAQKECMHILYRLQKKLQQALETKPKKWKMKKWKQYGNSSSSNSSSSNNSKTNVWSFASVSGASSTMSRLHRVVFPPNNKNNKFTTCTVDFWF